MTWWMCGMDYGSRVVFRADRSLTVAAPIRAARVSRRFSDTLGEF